MAKNVDQVIRNLSPERRRKVEARAAELMAEEMTLRELRAAHQKTQVSVAAALGIGQEGVSRLEQRSDLLISTLRDYLQAMGGNLELVARFPDRKPVVVTGFGDMGSSKRRAAAKTHRPRVKGTPAKRTVRRERGYARA
jgi:hypothetical protein